MLFFEYETSFAMPRIEPELYIEETTVRVYAYDDHDERFLVGVLLADNVRADCAANDGVPLYQVFDMRSLSSGTLSQQLPRRP